jgi:hypothetical protein
MTARIRENLARVQDRIAAACSRSRRDPSTVTLVAVTKYVSDDEVKAVLDLGIRDLGESRAVEGSARAKRFGPDVRWHFIGHLQTNKAGKVLSSFHVIHSLDRPALAEELTKRSRDRNSAFPVLVQVNVSGEATKGGYRPEDVSAAMKGLRGSNLEVAGLMTMAPAGDPETARPHFRKLRELAAACGVTQLSMGMTGDFEAAIEEGATLIRVGTALFESSK